MNSGMKVISVITSFVIIAFLIQIAYANNQTNSTRMKIYVTNLTITKSQSTNAAQPQSANLNYSHEVSQPSLEDVMLLAAAIVTLIMLLFSLKLKMLKPKAKRKHKSKFSKRKRL
jgi:hypothetical protein